MMTRFSDGKILGVIPARFESRRFPGKVLVPLDGLPMVARVYSQAKDSSLLDDLIVATDSAKVEKTLKGLDIPVTLTSPSHRSGTERVAEVAGRYPGVSLVVNIQGDEPFIDPRLIDQVVNALMSSRGIKMITAGTRRFRDGDWSNPEVVKVRIDAGGLASDFFRTAPGHDFPRDCLKHVGLYVYRKDFLMELVSMDPSSRELERDLEQMRALDGGVSIKVVTTHYDSLGVNTPQDLEQLREVMGIA